MQSHVREQYGIPAIDPSDGFTYSLKTLIASIPKSDRKVFRLESAASAILTLCNDDFTNAQSLVDTISCFDNLRVRYELLKLIVHFPKRQLGTCSFSDIDRAFSTLFLMGESQERVLSFKLNLTNLIVLLDDPIANDIATDSAKAPKKVQLLVQQYVSFLKKTEDSVTLLEARTLCSSLLAFSKSQPDFFSDAIDTVQFDQDNFLDTLRSLDQLNNANLNSVHIAPVLETLGVLIGKKLPFKRRSEFTRKRAPSRISLLLKISDFLDSIDNPDFDKVLLQEPGILKILLTSYDRVPSEEKLTNALDHLRLLLVQSNQQESVYSNAKNVFGSSVNEFFRNLGWRSFLGLEMIALKKISNYDPDSFSKGLRIFFSSKNWGHKTSPSHDDLNRVGDAYLMLADHWRRNWDSGNLSNNQQSEQSSFEIGVLGCAALNSFTTHPNSAPLKTKFDRMVRAYRGISNEISLFGIDSQELRRVLRLVPLRESSGTARLEEILLIDTFIDGHSSEKYESLAKVRAYQIRSFILPMIDSGLGEKVFQNSFFSTTYSLAEVIQKLNGRLPKTFHDQIISLTNSNGTNFIDWLNDCLTFKEIQEKDLSSFVQFCISVLSKLPDNQSFLSPNTSTRQVSCLFSLWQQGKLNKEDQTYIEFGEKLIRNWDECNHDSLMEVLSLPQEEFHRFWSSHLNLLLDATVKYPKYLPQIVWLSFIEHTHDHIDSSKQFSVVDLRNALNLIKGRSEISSDKQAERLTSCLSFLISRVDPSEINYFFSILSELLPENPSLLFERDPDSNAKECDALINRFHVARIMGEGTIYSWNHKTVGATALPVAVQPFQNESILGFSVTFRGSYPQLAETHLKMFQELLTSRGQFSRFDIFEPNFSVEHFEHELVDAIVQVRQKDLKQQLDSKDELVVDEAIEELKEICNHAAFLILSRSEDLFSNDSKQLIDSIAFLLDVILLKEDVPSLEILLEDEELFAVAELHNRIEVVRKIRAQSYPSFEGFVLPQVFSLENNESLVEEFQRFVHPKGLLPKPKQILQQLEHQYNPTSSKARIPQQRQDESSTTKDSWVLLHELSIKPFNDDELTIVTRKIVDDFHPLFFSDADSAKQFIQSLEETSQREPSQFLTEAMIERQQRFFALIQKNLNHFLLKHFPEITFESHDEEVLRINKKGSRTDSVDGALTHLLHLKLVDDLSFFEEKNREQALGKIHPYLQLLTHRRMLQDVSSPLDNSDVEQFLYYDQKVTDRSRVLFNELIPFYLRSRLTDQGKRISKLALEATDSLSRKAVMLLTVSRELQDFFLEILDENCFGDFATALDERNQKLRMLINEVTLNWDIEETPSIDLFTAEVPSLLFSDSHAREGKNYCGVFFMNGNNPVLIAYSRSIENPLQKLVYSPVGRLMIEGMQ